MKYCKSNGFKTEQKPHFKNKIFGFILASELGLCGTSVILAQELPFIESLGLVIELTRVLNP